MPLLYQGRCPTLSLADPEPSQPVPQADEELFPQTFQPVMHVGWVEVA